MRTADLLTAPADQQQGRILPHPVCIKDDINFVVYRLPVTARRYTVIASRQSTDVAAKANTTTNYYLNNYHYRNAKPK